MIHNNILDIYSVKGFKRVFCTFSTILFLCVRRLHWPCFSLFFCISKAAALSCVLKSFAKFRKIHKETAEMGFLFKKVCKKEIPCKFSSVMRSFLENLHYSTPVNSCFFYLHFSFSSYSFLFTFLFTFF